MNLLKLPWSIAPLKGKYYGTEILDGDGDVLFKIWEIPWGEPGAEPSRREGDREIFDSHYESIQSYEIAKAIVNRMNWNIHAP